jgi:hypothetical protein
MSTFLKKQTDFFNKEMVQWKKKEANLLKKLKTEEEKQEEAAAKEQQKQQPKRGGRTQVKVRTKPEHPSKRPKAKKHKPTEEEIKKKEEEEAKKKAEEEEAKRKEEEEAKKKAEEATKQKGKKGAPPPEPEEEKELTEEEKKAKEMQLVNKNLEEVRDTIKKLDDKLQLIQQTMEKYVEEAKQEKVLDLQDKNGDRKYTKTKADSYASEFLTEKMSYVLGKVVKNEQEEEEFKEVKIDGA